MHDFSGMELGPDLKENAVWNNAFGQMLQYLTPLAVEYQVRRSKIQQIYQKNHACYKSWLY